MAVPARPTAGAPIESAWGSVVHDAVVAQDIQSGTGNMSFANSPASGALLVTFPRPFAAAPVVVATMGPSSGAGANANIGLQAAATATGVTLQAREVRETALNGAYPFTWVAIGPRA